MYSGSALPKFNKVQVKLLCLFVGLILKKLLHTGNSLKVLQIFYAILIVHNTFSLKMMCILFCWEQIHH